MRKKGELVDTVVGLIIAVACVTVLVILVSRLIDPGYNERDEIAKAYFERLKEGIESGSGEILMLERGDDVGFYLAYFGSAGSVKFEIDGEEKTFQPKNVEKNVVCICYDKIENVFCRYCEDLDLVGKSVGEDVEKGEYWVFEDGDKVGIKKEGDSYVFFR